MADLWAPELHVVDGNWYVYFAADVPPKGNASHRMYVLRGPPASVNPMDPSSTFTLVGQFNNLPDHWQIDGTLLTLNNQLYFVYSGWPLDQAQPNDLTQQLFIAKMTDPVTADTETTVTMISTPTFDWEKLVDPNGTVHAINEGPAWLELGGFQGIVFSAGASWTNGYQLGILKYLGGNPMDPNSWQKVPQPLLCNNPNGQGPYGPGHCSYSRLPPNKLFSVLAHSYLGL